MPFFFNYFHILMADDLNDVRVPTRSRWQRATECICVSARMNLDLACMKMKTKTKTECYVIRNISLTPI